MTDVAGQGFLPVELFVVLVLIASGVAILARRAAIPYSVALVLAGLGIAIAFPDASLQVTPELILAVLLPGLVFEAAYRTHVGELRRTFGFVVILAAPGVLITAGIVAAVVSAATGLDPRAGFLLGAMISATDPAAVVALFRRLHAPRRLTTLVEAESLLNDGTGVVLFAIALQAMRQPIGIVDGAWSFVATIAISAAIGVVAGWLARRVMHATDDHLIAIAISIGAAYGTYLLADRFHESGIIATVVVGLMLGDEDALDTLSVRTQEALDIVWESIAFLLTALVFLLVGLVITPDLLVRSAAVIVSGYVAITVARAIVVYGVIGGGERLLPRVPLLPTAYLHVMFWAGLRGAVAVALALALPLDLPDRDLLTGAVYGVVLITLLVQGTTAGWMIRRTGVRESPQPRPEWPVDAESGGA